VLVQSWIKLYHMDTGDLNPPCYGHES
jgi:hypothetical protein